MNTNFREELKAAILAEFPQAANPEVTLDEYLDEAEEAHKVHPSIDISTFVVDFATPRGYYNELNPNLDYSKPLNESFITLGSKSSLPKSNPVGRGDGKEEVVVKKEPMEDKTTCTYDKVEGTYIVPLGSPITTSLTDNHKFDKVGNFCQATMDLEEAKRKFFAGLSEDAIFLITQHTTKPIQGMFRKDIPVKRDKPTDPVLIEIERFHDYTTRADARRRLIELEPQIKEMCNTEYMRRQRQLHDALIKETKSKSTIASAKARFRKFPFTREGRVAANKYILSMLGKSIKFIKSQSGVDFNRDQYGHGQFYSVYFNDIVTGWQDAVNVTTDGKFIYVPSRIPRVTATKHRKGLKSYLKHLERIKND